MKSKRIVCLSLVMLFASLAGAQPVIDGTLLGDETTYGPVLSIQDTDTHFGNNDLGLLNFANGSEIDQVFGVISGGNLNMLITGNLESNFNKLEVFIDSVSGGVNQIVGANLPTMVDGYCCTLGTPNLPDPTSGALQRMDGLTFDAGIEPDYYLTLTHGNEGLMTVPEFWALTAHYADLTQGTAGDIASIGMQLNAQGIEPGLAQGEPVDQNNNGWDGPDDPNGSPPEHEFVEPVSPTDPDNLRNHRDMENTVGLRMALNNSNTAGVNGSGGPTWNNTGDPENVVTGIEFSIPLAAIGNPTGDIFVTAFVNGNGHDFASNQFAGDGLAGAAPVGTDGGNPGGDGFGGFTGDLAGVNLANIGGNQFVTVPAPMTIDIDFNGDTMIDCADVDALVDAIVNGGDLATFDLNGSGAIDDGDLEIWLADAATANGFGSPYKVGDANLDGFVDVSDFNIWNSNKFTAVAAWCLGDFNADGVVDVSDFNGWNSNKFTSSDVFAVPEPAGLALLAAGVGGLLVGLRRMRR